MSARTNNVLKPVNTNMQSRSSIELSASKRMKTNNGEPILLNADGNRWSLGVRQEESAVLAEMGVGVLEPDENVLKLSQHQNPGSGSDADGEESSSPPNGLDNDHTNPELIVLNNKWISSTSGSPVAKTSGENSLELTNQRRGLIQNCTEHEFFNIIRRRVQRTDIAPDYFSTLPDELILQIFKYLPKSMLMQLSVVSKNFCRLSRDESLWTRLDLSMRCLYKGALGQILNKQVQVLKLAQTEVEVPAILPNSEAYYDDFESKLQFLDLSSCVIPEPTLALLFKRCFLLRKLSLESVKVNENICANLSQNKNLEVLNMAMVSGLTFKCMKYLMDSLKKLKELNIGWTHLNNEALTYVTENLPETLSRLNISGCRRSLLDKNVSAIVKQCPNLRELDLSDCTSLTADTVDIILSLNQLNFLALSRCYSIPPISLKKLKQMQSLSYFDIHGHMGEAALNHLKELYGYQLVVNKFMFSSVARPTVGMKRTSIWNMRVRD